VTGKLKMNTREYKRIKIL